MESYIKLLNNLLEPTKVINSKMSLIIEAFTSFYGESVRERIIDKFQNVVIVGQILPSEIKKICNMIRLDFKNKMYDEILCMLNISRTADIINKLDKLCYDVRVDADNDIEELIYGFICDNTSLFLEDEDLIDDIIDLFDDKMDLESYIDWYISLIEKPSFEISDDMCPFAGSLDYEGKISKYNYYLFVVSKMDIFPKNIQIYLDKVKKIFEKHMNDDVPYEGFCLDLKDIEDGEILDKIKRIVGDFSHEGLIDKFSDFDFSLQNDFIESSGILDNYDDEIPNLTSDMINEVLCFRQNAAAGTLRDICEYTELYETNMEAICDGLNYYTEENYVNDILFNLDCLGFENDYVFEDNGQICEKGFIMIHSGRSINTIDDTIIHELNHWFETDLVLSGDKHTYYGTNGWNEVCGNIHSDCKTGMVIYPKNKKYNLFNEIINDTISREIADILHNQNGFILNPNNGKLSYSACYDCSLYYDEYKFLTNGFYLEFKDLIIESRREGNFDILRNTLGYEFELLNDLINDCDSRLGDRIDEVRFDFENGVNSTDTNLYFEYIKRADFLVSRMKKNMRGKVRVKC